MNNAYLAVLIRIISGIVGALTRMRSRLSGICVACIIIIVASSSAIGQEADIREVESLSVIPFSDIEPGKIIFTEARSEGSSDPHSVFIRFSDWARGRPLQKEILAPHSEFAEPLESGKIRNPSSGQLHIYIASARFLLLRQVTAVNLKRYVSVTFVEKIDPAVTHEVIQPTELESIHAQNGSGTGQPNRRYCSASETTLCLHSRYKFEGRLPTAIRLVNKLRDGSRPLAENIEFKSEFRTVAGDSSGYARLRELTNIDAFVIGALEQSIFQANQLIEFGKLLAVFQAHPFNERNTLVTAFVVVGVKSSLLEMKKEYAKVPVLKNLTPAQVLLGNSSFNTGTSISAGLPKYARSRIRTIATLLATSD